MSDVIERAYGEGLTAADIEHLKPGYVVVEGVRPPAEVDGMKTPVADLERATVNCALHRVVLEARAWDQSLPAGAVGTNRGDIVRVRHEHLEQLDVSERGLCAINAQHIIAVLKSDSP